jgi:hypothetical protein
MAAGRYYGHFQGNRQKAYHTAGVVESPNFDIGNVSPLSTCSWFTPRARCEQGRRSRDVYVRIAHRQGIEAPLNPAWGTCGGPQRPGAKPLLGCGAGRTAADERDRGRAVLALYRR